MSQQILSKVARRLGISESELRPVFETVIQRIQQQVAHYGYARLAGLGTFRSRDGELTFEPDAVLTETANLPYAGLEPIRLGRPGGAAARPVEDLPEEHTLAEFEDDEKKWDETSGSWDEDSLDESSDEWEDDWDDATEDHPLGPLPADEFEDADFSVVDDEGSAGPLPELQFEDDEDASNSKDSKTSAATSAAPEEPEDLDEPAETDDAFEVGGSSDLHRPPIPAEPPAAAESRKAEESPDTEKPADTAEPAEPVGAAPVQAPARRDWPSERAERRGLDGTASRRNTILIGAGLLIIIAAAAVGYLSMQPAEPTGTEIASEAEEPQATAAGSAEADDEQAADTATDVAGAPAGSDDVDAGAEPPADPGSTPLRSQDGIDAAEGGFTIVVYSETSEASAQEEAQEYGDEGFRSGIVSSQDNGVPRYRVGVGQFETLEEAMEARDELAGNELPDDAWVYRLE